LKTLIVGSSDDLRESLIKYLTDKQIDVITDASDPFDISEVFPKDVNTVVYLALGHGTAYRDLVTEASVLFSNCVKNKVEKVVVVTSYEVLGTSSELIPEDGKPNPTTRLGAIGALTETLVNLYVNDEDLQAVIVRIPDIFENVHPLPTEPIMSEYESHRQWVTSEHVCDFINYLLLASFIPPKTILHVSGSDQISTAFFAQAVLGMVKSDVKISIRDGGRIERFGLKRTEATDHYGCPIYDKSKFFEDVKRLTMEQA
jgi:nucleoside-diphosphate-sugar epimerase